MQKNKPSKDVAELELWQQIQTTPFRSQRTQAKTNRKQKPRAGLTIWELGSKSFPRFSSIRLEQQLQSEALIPKAAAAGDVGIFRALARRSTAVQAVPYKRARHRAADRKPHACVLRNGPEVRSGDISPSLRTGWCGIFGASWRCVKYMRDAGLPYPPPSLCSDRTRSKAYTPN